MFYTRLSHLTSSTHQRHTYLDSKPLFKTVRVLREESKSRQKVARQRATYEQVMARSQTITLPSSDFLEQTGSNVL